MSPTAKAQPTLESLPERLTEANCQDIIREIGQIAYKDEARAPAAIDALQAILITGPEQGGAIIYEAVRKASKIAVRYPQHAHRVIAILSELDIRDTANSLGDIAHDVEEAVPAVLNVLLQGKNSMRAEREILQIARKYAQHADPAREMLKRKIKENREKPPTKAFASPDDEISFESIKKSRHAELVQDLGRLASRHASLIPNVLMDLSEINDDEAAHQIGLIRKNFPQSADMTAEMLASMDSDRAANIVFKTTLKGGMTSAIATLAKINDDSAAQYIGRIMREQPATIRTGVIALANMTAPQAAKELNSILRTQNEVAVLEGVCRLASQVQKGESTEFMAGEMRSAVIKLTQRFMQPQTLTARIDQTPPDEISSLRRQVERVFAPLKETGPVSPETLMSEFDHAVQAVESFRASFQAGIQPTAG